LKLTAANRKRPAARTRVKRTTRLTEALYADFLARRKN
jgi:hypothetical protein